MRRTDKDIKHALQLLIESPVLRPLVVVRVARREDRGVAERAEDQSAFALVCGAAEPLQRRPHVRVRLARDPHHLPEQRFRVDVRDRWDFGGR